jgi:simple sugar transport system ATP-binding protein
MAELMVGSALASPARAGKAQDFAASAPALEVRGLSAPSPIQFGTALKDISFSVAKGEVLGIAGVAGNGQDELILALSGEIACGPDMIRAKGEAIGAMGPNARRARGFAVAPEDRLGHGAAPDMSLTENAFLTGATARKLTKRGFVDWAGARGFTAEIIAAFDVRTPGPDVAARALSGGNLQKFVIGRELRQNPSVIVINQPTWGVDAAAAAFIRQAILTCAEAGAAVVLISQDLDELLEISDSFAVLNAGRLSVPRPRVGLSMEAIGLMMGGADSL